MQFWVSPNGIVQAGAGRQIKCPSLTEHSNVQPLIDEAPLELTSTADQGSCTNVDPPQAVKAAIEGPLDPVSATSLLAGQALDSKAILPDQVCSPGILRQSLQLWLIVQSAWGAVCCI